VSLFGKLGQQKKAIAELIDEVPMSSLSVRLLSPWIMYDVLLLYFSQPIVLSWPCHDLSSTKYNTIIIDAVYQFDKVWKYDRRWRVDVTAEDNTKTSGQCSRTFNPLRLSSLPQHPLPSLPLFLWTPTHPPSPPPSPPSPRPRPRPLQVCLTILYSSSGRPQKRS